MAIHRVSVIGSTSYFQGTYSVAFQLSGEKIRSFNVAKEVARKYLLLL